MIILTRESRLEVPAALTPTGKKDSMNGKVRNVKISSGGALWGIESQGPGKCVCIVY